MLGVRPPVKLAAALGAGGSFLAAGLITLSPSASAAPQADTANAAARWQAGELENGGIPGFSPGQSDWGLTIDTLIALKATGVDKKAADEVVATLKKHVRDYNSYDAWGDPGQRVSGATAKLLYAAVAAGEDPAKFGKYNLRQETLDLIAGPDKGLEKGRLKDKITAGEDSSNTFGQSLAVLGLARSGDVPRSAVDFLIDQQCAAGGFRLYPYAFGSTKVTGDCDAQGAEAVLDPDSTAMAVQALLAAADDGVEGAAAAAKKGGEWLAKSQKADGSLIGSGPTAFPNANSTGLGGQALAATGHQAAADKAAAWVKAHQLTTSNAGAASAEVGAIAYNDESLAGAKADGIAEFARDQWRRSTPQALLALAQIPLGKIGLTDPGPDPSVSPSTSPSDKPSPTPSKTPSSSPSTTPSTTPSGSASATPSGTPSPGGSSPATTTSGTPSSPASGGGGRGPLANTGSNALALGGAAAALTAGGFLVLRTSKRRRGSHT